MTLKDLTAIIDMGTLGNSVPGMVVIPFPDWNALRVQAGCWAHPDVHYAHFLWRGIPITFYEEVENEQHW